MESAFKQTALRKDKKMKDATIELIRIFGFFPVFSPFPVALWPLGQYIQLQSATLLRIVNIIWEGTS